MSDEHAKIDVEMPEDWFEIIQAVATKRGISIDQVICEAIEQYIQRYKTGKQHPAIKRSPDYRQIERPLRMGKLVDIHAGMLRKPTDDESEK